MARKLTANEKLADKALRDAQKDQERFDDAVRELAEEDGVDSVLALPGVWEIVSEHYNNAALDRMKEEE